MPRGVTEDAEEGLLKEENRVWVSGSDQTIQLKVLVGSHCGSIWHHVIDSSKSIVKEAFWWHTLDDYIR